MVLSTALALLVFHIIGSDAKQTCLSNCTIIGILGEPLVIPDGRCFTTEAESCLADVSFQYYLGEYVVVFSTTQASFSRGFIYALPPNYLFYSTLFSCSLSPSCAFDFARKKVMEFGNRSDDALKLTAELAPILLESGPTGDGLSCFDNDPCPSGVCQIDYDTNSNSVTASRCETQSSLPRVSVYDAGTSASFTVECNRTKCNSVQTLNQVKAIFARFMLTDTNGRIPIEGVDIVEC